MKRMFLLAAATFCCAASLSCSEGTETSPDASSQTADASSVAVCDRAKLTGLWTSANYSIRIASDLSFEAAGAPNMAVIQVTGTLGGEGCTLTFTDSGGTYACPGNQTGTYTFSVTESALHLQLVEDACEGRRRPLDGVTLTRN